MSLARQQIPTYPISDIQYSLNFNVREEKIATEGQQEITNVKKQIRIDIESVLEFNLTQDGADMELDTGKLPFTSMTVINGDESRDISANDIGKNKKIKLGNLKAGTVKINVKTADIDPSVNKNIGDMQMSGDNLFVGCEPTGFRNLMPSLDAPHYRVDKFTTTFSQLPERWKALSIGKRQESGAFVCTEGLPTYLYGMIAGPEANFAESKKDFHLDSFTQMRLRLFSKQENSGKFDFAINILKKAIISDVKRYKLMPPWLLYRMIILGALSYGAMEIPSLTLYSSETIYGDLSNSSAKSLLYIVEVLAHEFFHEQRGNAKRISDFTETGMKEGLTQFATYQFLDQLFGPNYSAIARLRSLDINNDQSLKKPIRQLYEDKSQDAYTACYDFFNNYRKAPSVMFMLSHLIGEAEFNALVSEYLKDQDTVMDFDNFLELCEKKYPDACDYKLFGNWIDKPGLPDVTVSETYDKQTGTLTLKLTQNNQYSPNDRFVVPLKFAMFGQEGQDILSQYTYQTSDNSQSKIDTERGLITLNDKETSITFTPQNTESPHAKPIISMNRALSGYVNIKYPQSDADCSILVRHETDGVSKIRAFNCLLDGVIDGIVANPNYALTEDFAQSFDAMLDIEDPMLFAQAIEPRMVDYFIRKTKSIGKGHQALRTFRKLISENFEERIKAKYLKLDTLFTETTDDCQKIAIMEAKRVCLVYIDDVQFAKDQIKEGITFDDELNLTFNIARHDITVMDNFLKTHRDDNTQYLSALKALATVQTPASFELIKTIVNDPERFDYKNPKQVFNLFNIFTTNPTDISLFHNGNPEIYDFVFAMLKKLNDEGYEDVAKKLKGAIKRNKPYLDKAAEGLFNTSASQYGITDYLNTK